MRFGDHFDWRESMGGTESAKQTSARANRIDIKNKRPGNDLPGLLFFCCDGLNVGAVRHSLLYFCRRRSGKLDGKRHFALVAQHVEFHRAVFIIALGGKFAAKFSDRMNSVAIHGSDYVASFEAGFFSGRS